MVNGVLPSCISLRSSALFLPPAEYRVGICAFLSVERLPSLARLVAANANFCSCLCLLLAKCDMPLALMLCCGHCFWNRFEFLCEIL